MVLALILQGCIAMWTGHKIPEERLHAFKVGSTTPQDVEAAFGPPEDIVYKSAEQIQAYVYRHVRNLGMFLGWYGIGVGRASQYGDVVNINFKNGLYVGYEKTVLRQHIFRRKPVLPKDRETFDPKAGNQSNGSAPAGFDVAALQQQMQALPPKIDAYQQRGGDMSRVAPRVESIQRHIGAGELEQAYEELQALYPILAAP
jgi:hypothetical protein